MAARIALAVVVLGLIGCALLQLRHARLQAAHELAAAHERVRSLDEAVLRTRAALTREAARRAAERLNVPAAQEAAAAAAGEAFDAEPAADA